MRLRELISKLEELLDECGGDAEVRLMTQQSYPFENSICGVTTGREINEDGIEDDEGDDDVEDESIVYLVEGGQICYGSKRAWEVCE
jgi:hypothetical protein